MNRVYDIIGWILAVLLLPYFWWQSRKQRKRA